MNNSLSQYEQAAAAIKKAIELSRLRAARAGNSELLSLYYGIGRYVSANTRNGTWGSDAIGQISKQLQEQEKKYLRCD